MALFQVSFLSPMISMQCEEKDLKPASEFSGWTISFTLCQVDFSSTSLRWDFALNFNPESVSYGAAEFLPSYILLRFQRVRSP